MYEYGKMLFKKANWKSEKEEALQYLIKEAEQNCLNAMFKYGIILTEEDNDQANKEKGMILIKSAATKGYPKSLYYCALLLEKDASSNKDEYMNYLKKQ